MLGRHHVLLSAATAVFVSAPVVPVNPLAVIVFVVAVAIGSLLPDADSPDAAIFHTEVRGLRGSRGEVLNAIGPLLPVFGYTTRYLVYRPAVIVADRLFTTRTVEAKHRAFLHSLLGAGTITIVLGVYLVAILLLLGTLPLRYLGLFLAGIFLGVILHLVQDSCTKSGIRWAYPFESWRLRGRLRTTARSQDTVHQRQFVSVLSAGGLGAFVVPLVSEPIGPLSATVITVFVAAGLWTGFARGVAGCHVDG